MNNDTASADLPGWLYRSEAFTEDLEGFFDAAPEFAPQPELSFHAGWFFMLPLALVLLSSVSALAWA